MSKLNAVFYSSVSRIALITKIPGLITPKRKKDIPKSIRLMADVITAIAVKKYKLLESHFGIRHSDNDGIEHVLEFEYTEGPDSESPELKSFTRNHVNQSIVEMLEDFEVLHPGSSDLVFYPEEHTIVFSEKTALLMVLGDYIGGDENELSTPDLVDFSQPMPKGSKKEGFRYHQAMIERISRHSETMAEMIRECIDIPTLQLTENDFLQVAPVRSYLSLAHYKATAVISYHTDIRTSLDHIAKTIDLEEGYDPSPKKIRDFNLGGYH